MWTQSGDLTFTGLSGGAVAHSGRFGAFFGPINNLGFLSQTLTTTPGGRYFITFWLRNQGNPSEFGVFWDGRLFYGYSVPAPEFAYQQIAIGPVVASGASTELTFAFRNEPDFFWFDDVDVYPDQGGGTTCSQIPRPDMAMYLTTTRKCDISRFFGSNTDRCVNTDGSTAAMFNPVVNVRRIGMGWATWSSPPEAEEALPYVGFNNGGLTDMVTLTNPASIAGLEIEPNTFDPFFTISVSFRDASGTEVFNVTRDITGRAGARLFAVSCNTPTIKSIFITSPLEAQGFAVAQIRADTIAGGATEGPPDQEAPPVSPNATANSE